SQAAGFASPSISILTFLPTRTPPVSRAWFQVRPNSSRSTSVLIEKPQTAWPHGLVPAPPYSTSSSTSLVTSRMVRSPTTLNSSPPSATMRLLLKVISGNFSTERKSSLRRWPSRSATPVLMLSVLMVSSAVDCSGSSAMVTVPEKSEKLPRTLLTIMCLTTKPMVVWATSRVYVPAAGMVRPFQLRVVMRIPYGNECLLRGQLLQQTSTRGIFPPSTNVVYSMDVTNVNDPRLTAFGLLSEVYAGLTARMQPVFAAAGL